MLVLASASSIRRTMLEQSGIRFEAVPAGVDEASVKAGVKDPASLATELAERKAVAVSSQRLDDWVIGSDSVVSLGDRLFDKPRDRDEAARHLRAFSGNAIRLTSAVALARKAAVDWSATDSATLRVRALSDRFVSDYLDAEWPGVGQCVGVFRLEGRGIQLFDSIEGSFFTILGMPLLQLLGALRERGLIAR
ncbi:MAG TPA: Maf family nucleotide pyrophosphatase [Sphingomicrobium sp.]|nr:Maf family nucleotide pyrophosphatase [Sphingomicrobium sp.]